MYPPQRMGLDSLLFHDLSSASCERIMCRLYSLELLPWKYHRRYPIFHRRRTEKHELPKTPAGSALKWFPWVSCQRNYRRPYFVRAAQDTSPTLGNVGTAFITRHFPSHGEVWHDLCGDGHTLGALDTYCKICGRMYVHWWKPSTCNVWGQSFFGFEVIFPFLSLSKSIIDLDNIDGIFFL